MQSLGSHRHLAGGIAGRAGEGGSRHAGHMAQGGKRLHVEDSATWLTAGSGGEGDDDVEAPGQDAEPLLLPAGDGGPGRLARTVSRWQLSHEEDGEEEEGWGTYMHELFRCILSACLSFLLRVEMFCPSPAGLGTCCPGGGGESPPPLPLLSHTPSPPGSTVVQDIPAGCPPDGQRLPVICLVPDFACFRGAPWRLRALSGHLCRLAVSPPNLHLWVPYGHLQSAAAAAATCAAQHGVALRWLPCPACSLVQSTPQRFLSL